MLLYYDIPGNEAVTRIRQLNSTQLNATFTSNVENFQFESTKTSIINFLVDYVKDNFLSTLSTIK